MPARAGGLTLELLFIPVAANAWRSSPQAGLGSAIIAGFALIGASSYLPRGVKGWVGRLGRFALSAPAVGALALWSSPHIFGPQASLA